MAQNKFELSLLQAVSDWQCGSTRKRATELKEQCASLPDKFRKGVKRCYRQVGLTKGFVWDLIAEECLNEKVSSWTLSLDVAMKFKNGVPPQESDYQGVIVMVERPVTERVIVNIDRLYKDPDFLAAMKANKTSITDYTKGAGRYEGTQQEIVIEMDRVNKSQIHSLGGYSSDPNKLKQLAHINIYSQFGRLATAQELAKVESLVGPRWLSKAATKRVLERVDGYTEILREVKLLQGHAGTVV